MKWSKEHAHAVGFVLQYVMRVNQKYTDFVEKDTTIE